MGFEPEKECPGLRVSSEYPKAWKLPLRNYENAARPHSDERLGSLDASQLAAGRQKCRNAELTTSGRSWPLTIVSVCTFFTSMRQFGGRVVGRLTT
jgi:hypothetical protein